MAKNDARRPTEGPQSLVAIARAAYVTGDRELLRAVLRQLRDEYGIELRFTGRPAMPVGVTA